MLKWLDGTFTTFPLKSRQSVLVNIARFIVAFTFLFSGFTKLIDPRGTCYKITDYFAYFGIHTGSDVIPLTLSVALSTVEFLLGMYLLLGIRRKFTTISLLMIMSFLTPFTLFIAICNPVHDCGCFGDAITLTNWQTFHKNVVLFLLALFIFLHYKKMFLIVEQGFHWIVSLYTIIFTLLFSLYSIHYLPLLDFRPYKMGVNISKAMEYPEGAPLPEYETTFIMEKDGVKKKFTVDNYPDSTWTRVDTETRMISEGYIPPIVDFSISDEKRGDITGEILNDTNVTFLLISPHLEEASKNITDELGNIYDFCTDNGYNIYALTASTPEEIERWRYVTGAVFPIYQVDEIVLKTMIRSNPGLILIKQGTILNKWSCNNLPKVSGDSNLTIKELTQSSGYIYSFKVLLNLLMIYLIPLFFIIFASNLWKKRKKAIETTKVTTLK